MAKGRFRSLVNGLIFILSGDSPGSEAMENSLLRRVADYVHFATHGYLDNERPDLSAIVLSLVDREGNQQDGFLRTHDIYSLNLPAELVYSIGVRTLRERSRRRRGKAKAVDKTTNAKVKVTFFWPFYGDYWILDLGALYSVQGRQVTHLSRRNH